MLGETGARVFHSGRTQALDLGITDIDTADDYGKGHLAEQRIGKAIKGRREAIFCTFIP